MDDVLWYIFGMFTLVTGALDGFKSRSARNGHSEGISEGGHSWRVVLRMAVFVTIATIAYVTETFPESHLILKLLFLQAAVFWIAFEVIVHNIMFLPSLKGFIHIGRTATLDKYTRALGCAIGTALFGKGREYVGIANLLAYSAKFTALYAAIEFYNKAIIWNFY